MPGFLSRDARSAVVESIPALTWQQRLAGWVHLALYLLMICMPLLGWLALSAAGKPIPFFGLQLPALIGESKGVARLLKDIHETIGTIGYWLIGAHAAAARVEELVSGSEPSAPPDERSWRWHRRKCGTPAIWIDDLPGSAVKRLPNSRLPPGPLVALVLPVRARGL